MSYHYRTPGTRSRSDDDAICTQLVQVLRSIAGDTRQTRSGLDDATMSGRSAPSLFTDPVIAASLGAA